LTALFFMAILLSLKLCAPRIKTGSLILQLAFPVPQRQ
jgi:hypothetical protein